MAGWALAISILSLAVAVGSQVRELIFFRLTGPRVSAEAMAGVGDGASVVSGPAGFMLADGGLEQLQRQSDGQAMFGIKVTNSGRQAISVTGWNVACEVSGAAWLSPPPGTVGPPFPFKLEGFTDQQWFLPLETAVNLARMHRRLRWNDGAKVMPADEDERLIVAATTAGAGSATAEPVEVAQHVDPP